MDSHALQDFQSALTCSICMNYFLEPVTIDCGHTLCQPCLYFCWDEAQTPRCCSQCREIVEKTDYRTNTVVKKLASLARQARPSSDSNSGEQLCRRNGETKGLFCEVDKSLLSACCSESPEHVVHSYSPEACVAEENREKIVKKMDPLWQKTQEMQDNLNKEIRKSESFVDYVVLRRNMIKVQYQMMQQFLLEEERFQLKTLEREAQEILQQLRDSAIRMAQHREKLKEMYRELTELCHKSDMELLQVTKDLEDIFERIKLLEMQKLQPVNPELSSLHITGILDMLNKFRVHNGLIQGWANRYMSLRDEVRNRIFGGDGAIENPQRLESYVIWGVEAFNSGEGNHTSPLVYPVPCGTPPTSQPGDCDAPYSRIEVKIEAREEMDLLAYLTVDGIWHYWDNKAIPPSEDFSEESEVLCHT
ncbi:tripartite motif-containing protein 64-like [Callospermophilus lateralis]|uniref:tripartite motif-containing protein 64-like n=1 Tax=Callospermophilus lateralis TaxID=76772 RepID=UPI0040548EAB